MSVIHLLLIYKWFASGKWLVPDQSQLFAKFQAFQSLIAQRMVAEEKAIDFCPLHGIWSANICNLSQTSCLGASYLGWAVMQIKPSIYWSPHVFHFIISYLILRYNEPSYKDQQPPTICISIYFYPYMPISLTNCDQSF